ncbi:NAD(P)/FAD-dependent oxidoreductase [Streptomyces halobius]|uniref:FAD-dependent oxidoreductase n=1 Tax=Streptomyces halobius TaxID=2879846 RepID=A0ABY4MCP4_9ACTN|nr:FAD-dependent oxidoreductase [Streptomyces halobius]UQA95502.1 FAD-dependent oxidoreductase [Streptomyces halobius]
MTPTTRVVVIGGGMAGARLARQLTAAPAAPAGSGAAVANAVTAPLSVTVIGEEPHPPYNRVLLAEVLAGRYAPEVIELPAPGSGARRMSGVRAVRIDRDTRRVLCDDGQDIPYDLLVLATGANPVLPPLRGLFTAGGGDLPDGVHPFRTMDDCQALAAAVRPGAPVVVIGGGLLGVSAARALAGRGAQVVLAHQGEHLMERHLDADAAELLGKHMAALGIEVHTECRVRGIGTGPRQQAPEWESASEPASASTPESRSESAKASSAAPAPRAVRAVELADGFRLDAELVVLACGVRPRTGLAQAAGLDVGRGVRVDDTLRTSDPRIFAIGDCAEHNGTVYGLAGAAQEQADALARVLPHALTEAPSGPNTPVTSGTAPYTGTRALTRLTLASQEAPASTSPTNHPSFPFDLAAFGETTPLPGDDVVRLSDATRTSYRKVVVRGDRLVGGILLGDLGTVGALARTWEGDEPLPTAPLLHLLTTDGGF